MKFLVALALAVACAHADVSHVVQNAEHVAEVLKYVAEVNPNSYKYNYETSNGISAYAEAIVKNENSENAAQEVKGRYAYTGPDGVNYEIQYIADENGYQPQGAHLPTAPPVPEAIARALAYNAAHPSAEDTYVNPANTARAAASVASVPVATASKFTKPGNKPNRRF